MNGTIVLCLFRDGQPSRNNIFETVCVAGSGRERKLHKGSIYDTNFSQLSLWAHLQIVKVFLFRRLVFVDTEKDVEAKFSVESVFGESVIASVDNGVILLFQIEGVKVFVRES